MTTKGHCESSLGSFDECSAAHKRLSTLRPSHVTWAVSPPVGSYRLQPVSPSIIITQPESWYSFTVPCRVEGWVDLGYLWAGQRGQARSFLLCHRLIDVLFLEPPAHVVRQGQKVLAVGAPVFLITLSPHINVRSHGFSLPSAFVADKYNVIQYSFNKNWQKAASTQSKAIKYMRYSSDIT